MTLKLRRNILSYLSYAVLISLFCNAITKINFESLEIIDFVNIFGLVFIFASLIWILIHHNFIVIDHKQITIYKDFFRITRIAIADIDKVEESVGIVSNTNFHLKNGKKEKFTNSNLKSKDLVAMADFLSKMKVINVES
ncbi:MAG: hypothetical protein AAF620_00010 [Bacteroidota bacterium]